MENAKTRTPVFACVGCGTLIGEKIIENDVVKTTYDFFNHALVAFDHGDKTYYYFDKILLPVDNLEDALRFCRGEKLAVYNSVDGVNFRDMYSLDTDEDGEIGLLIEYQMADGSEIPF